MDNNTMIALVFILAVPTFLLTGILVYKIVGFFKSMSAAERGRRNFPALEIVDTLSPLCGRHNWERIKLAFPEIPVDKYLVCCNCGLISHHDGDLQYKLNKPGIDHLKEQLITRKIEDVAMEILYEDMETLCKIYVGQMTGKPDADIHTLKHFFWDVRLSVMQNTAKTQLRIEDEKKKKADD